MILVRLALFSPIVAQSSTDMCNMSTLCICKVSVHKSIIACSDYNVNMFIATMLNTILIGYQKGVAMLFWTSSN